MATDIGQEVREGEDGFLYTDYPSDLARLSLIRSLPARKLQKQEAWKILRTEESCFALANSPLFSVPKETRERADRYVSDLKAVQAMLEEEGKLDQPRLVKTPLWQEQLRGYWFARPFDSCLIDGACGSGKSLVGLSLLVNTECRDVLVLCPTTVRGVWAREFHRHCPIESEVCVLDHSGVKRKLKEAEKFLGRKTTAGIRVTVVNYESAWREPFLSFARSHPFDALVCDESHRIKTAGSKVSQKTYALACGIPKRLCLTGTPLGTGPLDAYGQMRVLDPALFGTNNAQFTTRYAVTNPQIPGMILQYINQDEFRRKYHRKAVRIRVDEIAELPPKVERTIEIELSPKSRKVYNELRDEAIAEVETQLASGEVSVPNVLALMIRLQQICCGFTKLDDEHGGEVIDLASEKRDALLDAVQAIDPSEPIAVFCRFKKDLSACESVAKLLGRRYGEISGNRKDLTPHATMPDNIDLMGVQVSSGGTGLDLTRARYIFYYSMSFDPIEYTQSMARAYRPGQKRKTFITFLTAVKTIEEKIIRSIIAKQSLNESILERGSLNTLEGLLDVLS